MRNWIEPAADTEPSRSFTDFLILAEPRLRRAFAAAYGAEVGREVAADALAYAWEHWARLREMDNPLGYLYRVGQTHARRYRARRLPIFHQPRETPEPWVEPALGRSLQRLSQRQRVAVVLVHGLDWTYQEVAEVLGVSRATVQTHVNRGMTRLREELGVEHAR